MKFRKTIFRGSRPGLFLGKGILKICSRFKGEHSCRNAISVKLLCNFIEIALRHGCSPVNLLHTFRTPFPETSGWLLLSKLLNLKSFKSILNTHFYFMKHTALILIFNKADVRFSIILIMNNYLNNYNWFLKPRKFIFKVRL